MLRYWAGLIAASDYLTAAAFDLAPGGTRHTLITGIAAIERCDMQATNLVTPAVVWRMHRDLSSLLIAHIRFFADETQLSVL